MMSKRTELNLKIASELAVVFVVALLLFGYLHGQQQTIVTTGDLGEKMIFAFTDPVGDDHGPGNYRYPTHSGFEPQKSLLDLLAFRVITKGDEAWYELDFGLITNPWNAPEGFFHQRIDIYIDSRDGYGRTITPQPGANVTFAPEYPWDLWIRIAPWGGSKAYYLEKDGDKLIERQGVEVGVVGDRTIRVVVPQETLPLPTEKWRYYVLVGGYDGFGPDGYRVVTAEGGEWTFAGGTDAHLDSNIIDLLAPKGGQHSQAQQLAYDVETQTGPVLYPVGNVATQEATSWIIGTLAVLVGGVAVVYWRRRHKAEE